MESQRVRHDTVTEQQINKFRKSISQIPTSIHNKNFWLMKNRGKLPQVEKYYLQKNSWLTP